MIHYGDITKIAGKDVPSAEVVIGGFPLVWSAVNGLDRVIWTCEIDDFCRAVTMHHFGGEVV